MVRKSPYLITARIAKLNQFQRNLYLNVKTTSNYLEWCRNASSSIYERIILFLPLWLATSLEEGAACIQTFINNCANCGLQSSQFNHFRTSATLNSKPARGGMKYSLLLTAAASTQDEFVRCWQRNPLQNQDMQIILQIQRPVSFYCVQNQKFPERINIC